MSNPTQQCPSAWRKYHDTGNNIRVCGRANNTAGSCSSVSLSMTSTGRLYGGVCGRVIGYQYGSPDAFRKHTRNDNINFDGINITYIIIIIEHNVTTSGAMLLVGVRIHNNLVAHVQQPHKAYFHHSLEKDITVNQEIQQTTI